MSIAYPDLYQIVTKRPQPPSVVQRTSEANVLNPGRGFIGAFDYTMQLQVGCPGGCLFCYVPASGRLTPPDMRQNWGFEVRTKRHAVQKFRRHLVGAALADRTVYWSGVTDPYTAPPRMTRRIWDVLRACPAELRPRRLAVQSRFSVDRDLRPLAAYCRQTTPSDGGPAVVVSLSLGTDRGDVLRSWERATPSFAARMNTIRRLCRAGIFVVVTLSPFGPWEDLRGTLTRLQRWGVRYLTVLFFKEQHSCASTPRPFLDYLRETWPQLLDPAWQADRLTEMREVFGPERVLADQPGFSSLVHPHRIASP